MILYPTLSALYSAIQMNKAAIMVKKYQRYFMTPISL